MVKIICDSVADMTQQEAAEKGVIVLPLKILIDGAEYKDGVDISSEGFYEKLDTCKNLPTTSQLTPQEFSTVYQQVIDGGDEAVVITMSSKLSGTNQSANIALEDFESGIYIVDSENATVGERILLDYAIRLRDQGCTAAQIAGALDQAKKRVCLVARVDTLEYLMRGGRLSRTAAIAGTVLNIKPVLSVEDGVLAVIGKARGSKQSNNLLTENIHKKGGIDFGMPIALGYTGTDDALLKGYIENSRALWEGHTEELPVYTVGSTIGTHAGPGAIVVAFFAKNA